MPRMVSQQLFLFLIQIKTLTFIISKRPKNVVS